MFLCEECHDKAHCQTYHMAKSRGRCEKCGEFSVCSDCHGYDFSAGRQERENFALSTESTKAVQDEAVGIAVEPEDPRLETLRILKKDLATNQAYHENLLSRKVKVERDIDDCQGDRKVIQTRRDEMIRRLKRDKVTIPDELDPSSVSRKPLDDEDNEAVDSINLIGSSGYQKPNGDIIVTDKRGNERILGERADT